MDRTIYFADQAVLFTALPPSGEWYVLHPGPADISRDKIRKILENHNSVAIVTPDPDAAYAAFVADFTVVEAAGGVVVNDRGEWLMIHRNGRWDLPKGHLECDERIDACAAREIAEETGVDARVVRPLCETLHAYYFAKTARWELKRTHWYELRAVSDASLQPQTEEGIDRVAWCCPEAVARNLADAFPTIRCVARSMNPEN